MKTSSFSDVSASSSLTPKSRYVPNKTNFPQSFIPIPDFSLDCAPVGFVFEFALFPLELFPPVVFPPALFPPEVFPPEVFPPVVFPLELSPLELFEFFLLSSLS